MSDKSHQRFVLTDPVAFRYLEEDPSTTVLERRRELSGYECYIVEQWATSRTHPTFCITTFTGDPSHNVIVGVLSVPTDESVWSQRLKVYFRALNQYHARRRETPLGILMITNLSGFPSSLTVIPVPDGDLRKHRADFFVNEDLKRLGCSGRVGLTLARPSGATAAKFHQLYRTSEKNDLYESVIELVKLCQAALLLFDQLEVDYTDGLLCDVTEKAINDWWTQIGTDVYNVEPHDGILGPTTVSALLGLLMGARNRLHAVSAPVPKDPFDIEGMKRGIAVFQKSQRLARSRRLDRDTLDRLRRASAKAATSEGWTMPRAVKSTVAELSGKGGEMVMDLAGRRDKAGIAEIETCDIDRFVQLIYGERCKWLWYGKPLKRVKLDHEKKDSETDHLVFRPDEHGGYKWTGRKPTMLPGLEGKNLSLFDEEELAREDEEDDQGVKSVVKRATGLISDSKSGVSRLKGAIGRRGHHHKHSKESSNGGADGEGAGTKRPTLQRSRSTPVGSPTSPQLADNDFEKSSQAEPVFTKTISETPKQSESKLVPDEAWLRNDSPEGTDEEDTEQPGPHKQRVDASTAEPSIAEDVYHGIELGEILPEPERAAQEVGVLLRRTNSDSNFIRLQQQPRSSVYYSRHISFSDVEESMMGLRSFFDSSEDQATSSEPQMQYDQEARVAAEAKSLRAAIANLDRNEAAWTYTQIKNFRKYIKKANEDQEYLGEQLYSPYHHLEELKDASAGLLRDEKEALNEGSKELETLAAKLDYEIGNLRAKVEEVEAGVKDFERSVVGVEQRLDVLEKDDRRGGFSCVMS